MRLALRLRMLQRSIFQLYQEYFKIQKTSILQLCSLKIYIYTSPSFLLSFLALPYAFELILLSVIYSTHFTAFNLIQFVLISHLRADNGLFLVIAFIGLLSLLIYLTLAISRLSYDWYRYIISIISLFSCIVPSLIRHL